MRDTYSLYSLGTVSLSPLPVKVAFSIRATTWSTRVLRSPSLSPVFITTASALLPAERASILGGSVSRTAFIFEYAFRRAISSPLTGPSKQHLRRK